MSLKDHLENTGLRGSDHQGSHTQTHILKDVPETGEDVPGQSSGDPRTQRHSEYANHAHAGIEGTSSGFISPQTEGEPSADPSTGTVESPVVRKGEGGKSR